jgi:hypothetical protein
MLMKKLLSLTLSIILALSCLSCGVFALANGEALELNTPVTVNIEAAGETKAYTFTPAETGLYVFYSTGSANPQGSLKNPSYSDKNSYDGRNFFICRRLTKGNTSTLTVKLENAAETGSFTLTVEKSEAASIEISAPTGISVTEYENGSYEMSMTLMKKIYRYSYALINFKGAELLIKNSSGEVIERQTIKGIIPDSVRPYFINTDAQRIPFLTAEEEEQLDVEWTADSENFMTVSYLDNMDFSLPVTVNHVFSTPTVVNPTCTEKGYTARRCTKCNKTVKSDETPALGHDYELSSVTEATCTEEGLEVFTCTHDSSHTYSNKIPALGHDFGEWEEETAAKCEEDGTKISRCSRCTEVLYDVIPAIGHDYELSSVTEATCTEEGLEVFTCTHDSNHTYSNKTPALGHINGEEVIENRKEPSCKEAGSYDTVIYCQRCEKEVSRVTTVIDALPHTWGEGIVTREPTVQQEGEMTYECTKCGAKKTEPIKKLPGISIKGAKISGIKNKTYTGKKLTQSPTVVLGEKTLTRNKDYKLEYKNNVKIGKASVTVVGIGEYEGSITKTFTVRPKSTKLEKIDVYNKGVTVKWKKATPYVTGYQIQYSTSKAFKNPKYVRIKGNSISKKAVTNLKKGKYYYFRIRVYYNVGGKNYYSLYSAKKRIKA